jgi:hypothetical protein
VGTVKEGYTQVFQELFEMATWVVPKISSITKIGTLLGL